ncbi:SAM-dependent methyltransferase, partial [Pseudomonas aeruginosa]
MMSVVKGRLLGLGVGPGDPELITLKALRLLRAAPVVGYFVAKGKKGNAFGIIEAHLGQGPGGPARGFSGGPRERGPPAGCGAPNTGFLGPP